MSDTKVVLDDAEYARVRLLLSRAAGLVFDESRRDSMGYSIGERLRATGIATVGAYLDEVCAPGSAERQRLIDEVTIQETHFFRNPPQMRALRAHVLPELIRHASTHGRRLRIWSAGCSTGEEPYTIAMMIRELLPSTAGWDIKETEGKSARGALPAGTVEVENLVGLFDRESGSGVEWTADEFNSAAQSYASQHGHAVPTALSDADVVRVRAAIRELQDAWRSTPSGDTMRVRFEP